MDAIAAYHKALECEPKDAIAYLNLGNVLTRQNRLPEAMAAYRKAIQFDPKDALAYYSLGNVLYLQKQLVEAITTLKKAVERDPTLAQAHCNIGHILRDRGDFAAALQSLERGHALGSARPGWPYASAAWVKQCQRLVALDQRLPAVLQGEAAGAAELVAMAEMCHEYKKRYGDAAALYRRAFAAQAALADNPLAAQHRYNAACAAALAGTAPGADKPALRRQALDWLRADLDVYGAQVKTGKAMSILFVAATLKHWQADPDFIGVREVKLLARLPEAQRTAWTKLWADVDQLLKQARSLFTTTTLTGTLTDQQHEQVHELKLQAGKTYVIDMKSTMLNSFLKLYDPAGEFVTENDDIARNVRDARIVFEADESGLYHITATSFRQRGRGAYTLTIRAVGR